jgi:TonB family protein
VRVSADITGPVTFGFLRPVVLVPERFRELSAEMQDAILCHEILHVRRHDWLFTAGEELIRALLWFHPAIWWLLREIQLLREEVVDREVVEITKSRDGYIDALLLIAGAAQSDLAPAPLFLRRQHLKHRVASILKEVRMSRLQSFSAFTASLTLVAASCWFITGALPLRGAPQIIAETAGVSVNTMGAEVLFRLPVQYPGAALIRGVQGTVVARVKLDAAGNVTDATILSGPEVLRKAVLQSVLNWNFSAAAAANGTQDVNVTFTKPAPGAQSVFSLPSTPELGAPLAGRKVRSIKIGGFSDLDRAQIEARLPLHEGDTFTPEKNVELLKLAQKFDGHVSLEFLTPGDDGILLAIQRPPVFPAGVAPPPQSPAAPPGISGRADVLPRGMVLPPYPPLALAAHVQGTVRFQATIGTDGAVKDLKLVSGPPLLVQAAIQAAKLWNYPPSATEIMTPIDITFMPE